MRILYFLLFTGIASCAVSNDPLRPTARALQKGLLRDDSSYVYALPYAVGKSYLMVQGYFTHFSHRNRAAIDFKMPEGTTVTAAREGVVVRTEKNKNRGGLNRKYRKDANYVVVKHDDGTQAGYWHLRNGGVLVNVGDSVKLGQPLGLSGNTGYTAFPHLHFFVWSGKEENWQQIPTRFHTRSGPRYLRPFRSYKSQLPEAMAHNGNRQ